MLVHRYDATSLPQLIPPAWSHGIDTYEFFTTGLKRPAPGSPLGISLHRSSPTGGVYVNTITATEGGPDANLMLGGLRPRDIFYSVNGVDVTRAAPSEITHMLTDSPQVSQR